jgi:hypothetical protein
MAAAVVLGLAALPASASAVTATKHHLDMYKAEQHVTLPEFDTNTYTVSCPNGDIAADGMWRIDEVGPYNPQLADDDELPWTIATGVSVIAAYPSGNSTYTFTFQNNTSDNAQLKLWVTCLGSQTSADTHQHPLVTTGFTAPNHVDNAGLQSYAHANTCGAGDIVISPGFRINAGDARIVGSFGSNNLQDWTWKFRVNAPNTNIDVFARCLKGFTDYFNGAPKNHRHKIYAYFTTAPVQHFDKGNGVWEHQISCRDDQKGLVGGFDVSGDPSWYWLGMDPRIKTRAFKTYGTGAGGSYSVICVNDRTSRPFYS